MSECNHMVGLAEADEGYLPVYKSRREINWGQMSAYGHVFLYCPDCGEDISAESLSKGGNDRDHS